MTGAQNKFHVSVYQKAKKGNFYCGDSYYYVETENEFICAIADGLGSGEFARESSQIVIRIIEDNLHASIEQLVQLCNKQLFRKRGVVLGLFKVSFSSGTYSFSSIGNIGIMTVSSAGKKKRYIPDSGYLAGYSRPFKVINGQLESQMNFLMFSDGVSDADLSRPFMLHHDVDEVIRKFAHIHGESEKDDTTLIAMNYNGSE